LAGWTAGGNGLNTFERIDTTTGLSTALVSFPARQRAGDGRGQKRDCLCVRSKRQQRVSGFTRLHLSSVTPAWTALGAMGTARAFHAMAAAGDFIYIFGGYRAGK
jgi:hypothetical protein